MDYRNKKSPTSGSLAIRFLMLLALGAVCVAMPGCKAAPAKNTSFVKSEVMTTDPSIPFQRVWRKPDFNPQRYKKLYVAEVNTAYMMKLTEWQEGTRKENLDKDVQDLGIYTRDTMRKSFQEDPQHRLAVVDTRPNTPDAIILEVALTEVVPSKVTLNALGYAPFGIGLALNSIRMMSEDISTVAFEARLRDAQTGEVVVMLADREAQQFAPITVRGLSWYGHAKTIIQDWSTQFVKVANRKPGEAVEEPKPFTLKPW